MDDSVCSGCGTAISGANVLYTADARPVCAACSAQADLAATAGGARGWMAWATAGAIAGAIPFAIHASSSSMASVDGHVTSFVYRDWIAVGGGAAAVALGVATMLVGRSSLLRMQAILAGIALGALGGYQVASGFGVFAAPAGSSFASASSAADDEPRAPSVATPPPAPPADPKRPETCANADACYQLGLDLDTAKDDHGALVAYSRACDLGGDSGCFNAGITARTATPPDLAKAAALFQHGCDLGHLKSCSEIGYAYLKGRGVATDDKRALSVFTAACERGGAMACANLGDMYENGYGVPVDRARSFELWAKACEGDAAPETAGACVGDGKRLAAGDGVKADAGRAAAYFGLACGKRAKECFYSALASASGDGVPKDPVAARALYGKACDAGDFDSCNNLGNLLFDGAGGAKDPAAAKALFKTACDGGVAFGCDNLKRK